MARTYATIAVTRYSDPGWRALSFAEQGAYDLILTHPKLSLCGVLDVKVSVLHQTARDATDTLETLWEGLEAHNFVLWDRDTHELAVRTFVRHDGALKNRNMAKGMWSAWSAVESLRLRRYIVENLPEKAFEPEFDPPPEALALHCSNSGSDTGSDCGSNFPSVSVSVSAAGSDSGQPVDKRFLPGTGWVRTSELMTGERP